MKDDRRAAVIYIVKLGREKAVEVIKDAEYVMFRRGVWNPYEKRKTSEIIPTILDTRLYGADVSLENGVFYVSCPVSSDMW